MPSTDQVANERFEAIRQIARLQEEGKSRTDAMKAVGRKLGASHATLRRWAAAYAEGGISALAPDWKPRKTGVLASNEALKNVIESLLKANPDASAAGIQAVLSKQLDEIGGELPSIATIRRFIHKKHGSRGYIRRRRGPVSTALALAFPPAR